MLGGTSRPDLLELSDPDLLKLIEQDLVGLFGLKGKIPHAKIHRWKRAIPVYNDHLLRTWKLAQEGWCSQPGKIIFSNYSGKVSLRGMIESLEEIPAVYPTI
jgi:protoporphyrinogen oxidase